GMEGWRGEDHAQGKAKRASANASLSKGTSYYSSSPSATPLSAMAVIDTLTTPKGKGTAVPSVSTSTRTTRSKASSSSAQPATPFRSALPQPVVKAPSTARKAPSTARKAPAAPPALKSVTNTVEPSTSTARKAPAAPPALKSVTNTVEPSTSTARKAPAAPPALKSVTNTIAAPTSTARKAPVSALTSITNTIAPPTRSRSSRLAGTTSREDARTPTPASRTTTTTTTATQLFTSEREPISRQRRTAATATASVGTTGASWLKSTFDRDGIEEEAEEEITPKRRAPSAPLDEFFVSVVGSWYFKPNIGNKTTIIKYHHISKLFDSPVCRECGDVFDKDRRVSKDSLPTLVIAHLIGCPPNQLPGHGDQLYQYNYAISDIPASVSDLIASCTKAEDGDLMKQVVEKVVRSGGGMNGSREGKEAVKRVDLSFDSKVISSQAQSESDFFTRMLEQAATTEFSMLINQSVPSSFPTEGGDIGDDSFEIRPMPATRKTDEFERTGQCVSILTFILVGVESDTTPPAVPVLPITSALSDTDQGINNTFLRAPRMLNMSDLFYGAGFLAIAGAFNSQDNIFKGVPEFLQDGTYGGADDSF
ncbi:hypothetical protein P7C70_g8090, partial [Phenoliferia sp. Uapishka_3]